MWSAATVFVCALELLGRLASFPPAAFLEQVPPAVSHEEWHVLHGPDEAGAYDAQWLALLTAGAHDDSLFHKVKDARLVVLASGLPQTGVWARRFPAPDIGGRP